MRNLFIISLIVNMCTFVNAQNNYYEKGINHYNSKNYAAAISELTKVIETEEKGNVLSALYIRAQCKNKLEDYRGALLDYNILFSIVEDESESLAVVYLDRGRIKAILKNYDGAEQDFTKAIELKDGYAEALINRGIIRSHFLEKTEKGCLDFSRAGELGITKAYELIKEKCL
jgi:tetratricopeptide (TPR) repeat protein